MNKPKDLSGLPQAKAYETIIEELRAPRSYILMDKDAYFDERRTEADKNLAAGVTRGWRNLIYYLTEIMEGRLDPSAMNVADTPKEEMEKLSRIITALRKSHFSAERV